MPIPPPIFALLTPLFQNCVRKLGLQGVRLSKPYWKFSSTSSVNEPSYLLLPGFKSNHVSHLRVIQLEIA